MRLRFLATLLLGGLFGAATANQVDPGHVVRADSTENIKTAPSGKASVQILSQGAKSAFVGLLTIDAGLTIPVHRDASEEFIYTLEGGGVITINGVEQPVGVGDFVFMPANAEVTFTSMEGAKTKVLQVFAPPESASKYDSWQ